MAASKLARACVSLPSTTSWSASRTRAALSPDGGGVGAAAGTAAGLAGGAGGCASAGALSASIAHSHGPGRSRRRFAKELLHLNIGLLHVRFRCDVVPALPRYARRRRDDAVHVGGIR